jgi:DNA-directed RNA polymerase specialized sigma24 family protein
VVGVTPQLGLDDFEAETDDPDLSVLTDAERDAYEACVTGDLGVREYARRTERRPGTVGNLLRRARRRLDGEEVTDTW